MRRSSPVSATYTIRTYDWDLAEYTPQAGMTVPSERVDIHGLRRALRDLRRLGYSCHRFRDAYGGHDDNDTSVLVERDDAD